MSAILDFVWIVAALPLATCILIAAAGRKLPYRGGAVGTVATAGSLLLSLWAVWAVWQTGTYVDNQLYAWTDAAPVDLTLGVLVDPLAALMLVIVSLIATLVHLFSLGYMNGDPEHRSRGGLPRYYAALGLFTASMLAFVFSSNLLMAFIFFELIGLCSYLLIGFWHTDQAPPSAAKKAFLITRFGDYFFLVGVIGVLATFGTTQFVDGGFPQIALSELDPALAAELGIAVENAAVSIPADLSPETWFSIIGLLILGGVLGKSAQFPLYTWLPDAMEGPTPVSALIHAATMVAAGVYLVARMFGFYAGLPTVLAIIAFIGGFTALIAAMVAVVKDDLKQVLAYSTISQYGYMMLGLGVGGYVAATFHLATHASFKALLFLAVGAIIVTTHHQQDMWSLGGLRDRLPIVHFTFLAGALALAGIAPLSGFWSKDEILFEALQLGIADTLFLGAYVMALLAVPLTGFYTFRMYMVTFRGNPRSEGAASPETVDRSMAVPLVVLGAVSVVAGVANMKPIAETLNLDILWLERWLNDAPVALQSESYNQVVVETAGLAGESIDVLTPAGIALGLALIGAGAAVALYRQPDSGQQPTALESVAQLLDHNFYQDEVQVWLADGLTQRVARGINRFDRGVVDGLVNGAGGTSVMIGERVRRIQTGYVQTYLTVMLLTLLLLIVILGVFEGWWM